MKNTQDEEKARQQMQLHGAERKVFKPERLRINDRAKYHSYNVANRPVNACSVDRTLAKTNMVSEAWREQAERVKKLRIQQNTEDKLKKRRSSVERLKKKAYNNLPTQ